MGTINDYEEKMALNETLYISAYNILYDLKREDFDEKMETYDQITKQVPEREEQFIKLMIEYRTSYESVKTARKLGTAGIVLIVLTLPVSMTGIGLPALILPGVGIALLIWSKHEAKEAKTKHIPKLHEALQESGVDI
jgi:hypothetical protein